MSHFSQLLLIGLLVVLAVAKTTVQSNLCKKHIRNTQDSVLYNAIFFLVCAAALFLLFPQSELSRPIVLYALFASLCTFSFQVTYSLALTCGPVSLTVLLANFNVLPVTAFCVIYCHERVYLTQLLGVAFLVCSMLLSVNRTADEKKGSARWLVLTLLTTAASTVSGCIQKVFGLTVGSDVPGASNTFLVVLYVFAALGAFSFSLVRRFTGSREKPTFRRAWQIPVGAAIVGIIIAVYQRFYMLGMVSISSMLFFPTLSGLSSLIMSLLGILLFRDTLSRRQLWGIVCGVCCIVLMNLKIGFSFAVG